MPESLAFTNDVENDSTKEIAIVDIFQKYGIPKHLPKLGISSLTQGDHIVEHVQKTTRVNEKETSYSFFLVQTTDAKRNIDLRMKYFSKDLELIGVNPSLTLDDDSVSSIEKITRTEYRLRQYAESYDKSSVTVEEIDENKVIVRFKYSKYGLPQDIAYFRFLTVEIVVVDKVPQTMRITNSSPFRYGDYMVNSYLQELEFTTLSQGVVVIKDKKIHAKGTSNGKPASISVQVKPVAFYDNEFGKVVVDNELLAQVSDPRISEERIEVDRLFPLMGDLVRRQGIDIPMPYGLSVAYRNQTMDVGFTDFTLGLGELGIVNLNKDFNPEESFGVVSAESYSIRGDVYILPFWNVYGLLGKINVEATVDAEYTAETMNEIKDSLNSTIPGIGNAVCNLIEQKQMPLCNVGRLRIPLTLNYDVVGIGTTLSIGYKEFFATLNSTYTKTRLHGSDSWGDGLVVVQPMVGYQFVDYRAQLLIGAEYQGLKATMKGNLGYVEGLNGDFEYDIGVKLNQWAYIAGFNKQIGKNYNITGLYNYGESRKAFTVSFGYRF